jgi:hypothetical protein
MQESADQTRAQKQSVPPSVKNYLSPSDPRVSSQPSLMPQVTRDSRLGSLPSDTHPEHLPMTPGQSMEEKYKMMERFCRQSWINHGMIGGGASVLASSAALWVAHKRSTFFLPRFGDSISLPSRPPPPVLTPLFPPFLQIGLVASIRRIFLSQVHSHSRLGSSFAPSAS